jgi:hypothetical protein
VSFVSCHADSPCENEKQHSIERDAKTGNCSGKTPTNIFNLTGYNAILRAAVNKGRDDVQAHIGRQHHKNNRAQSANRLSGQ